MYRKELEVRKIRRLGKRPRRKLRNEEERVEGV